MSDIYTIAEFANANPLRCTMRRIGQIDKHSHEFFEVDMILSGHCQARIGDEFISFNTDDVFSIDANIEHSFLGKDCTIISIQFDSTFFERTLPNPHHPRFLCNSATNPDSPAYDIMRRLIARFVKNNAEHAAGYELRNYSLIYELMDVMYQAFRVEESESSTRKAHRYNLRMAELIRIINNRYAEDLSLNALSDEVHLSVPYLSKFFTKQFGVSYLSYLSKVRLQHAVKELLNTDHNIETVSVNNGFPNSHAFVQVFKKEYGTLPSLYRRQNQMTETTPKILNPEYHDYMAGLNKYLETDHTASDVSIQSVSARIQLNVTEIHGHLAHTWKNILAVPSASDLLNSEFRELLKRIQQEIGFRYIRFNGVFSDEMHVVHTGSDGLPTFSFLYIDKVLDFLREQNFKPLIQLSFMPELLAAENKRTFGYLVSEPRNNESWVSLVEAFMVHIIKRYGIEEVRAWMFSVWEQPDTPYELYGFSNDQKFYRFYQATYQTVKKADSQIRFGSPSTYYILRKDYTNWYIPFLSWCNEHSCMPDFILTNYYDTVFTDIPAANEAFGFPVFQSNNKDKEHFAVPAGVRLRSEADGFNDFVIQIRKERVQLKLKNLPIYLGEWNNSPSQQDLLNDTCYKSCYIVRSILENYDKLDSFTYWSLSDIMPEGSVPAEQYHGGLGMFTSCGIPKASYYAFILLNKLGSEFLGRGDGWFASKTKDRITILLYNYRHYSHLYAMGERFNMTFTERYTPFSPETPLDVHIHLDHLSDGDYVVKETVVNRSSGSSFDQWLASGACEFNTPEELKTLAARSVPSFQKYTITSDHGILRFDALLEMLEVRLLEVSLQK